MKEKKKKFNYWAGSIAAALVAAIAIFAVMLQMEKNMLTQYEKGVIYVAAKAIPKGQEITADNASIYLERRELDLNCIPETALCSEEQVVELTAVSDIEKGVLLTMGMFQQRNDITERMEEPVIAGFKAEDVYQVAGGVLRRGDRIHVYNADEEGHVSLKWSNLFIQQVFDMSGVTIGNEDSVTSAQRINIYLDKSEVEQFYTELSTGSLRVVKVCDQP